MYQAPKLKLLVYDQKENSGALKYPHRLSIFTKSDITKG